MAGCLAIACRAETVAEPLKPACKADAGSCMLQAVFVIQRNDCSHFGVSHDSDPAFGKLLIAAAAAGVRILALRIGVDISPVTQAGTFTYLGPAVVDLDHRSDSWGCPLTNDA